MTAFRPRLGVIGGLGPLASADFYRKLTELTPAATDRDHVSLVLFSMTELPDRTEAILDGSDRLLAPLLAAVSALNALGVECIAMPCNTAHHWYEHLSAASKARIVHIVDSVLDAVRSHPPQGGVAILATPGTLSSGFYQHRLLAAGYDVRLPAECQDDVDIAIGLVKAGRLDPAATALLRAVRRCQDDGIGIAILACTELSVIADAIEPGRLAVVDSNAALASACLRQLGVEPVARLAARNAA